jgi:hypothetical protein
MLHTRPFFIGRSSYPHVSESANRVLRDGRRLSKPMAEYGYRAISVLLGCLTLALAVQPGQLSAAAQPAAAAGTTPLAAPTLKEPYPGIGQVALSWSAVAGASTYNVYTGATEDSAKSATTPQMSGVAATQVLVFGLPNQQQYFAVRAVFPGAVSGPSNVMPATPSLTAAPKDLKFTAKGGQASLTWTSIGATSYTVYSGTEQGKMTAVPELSSISGSTYSVTATIPNLKSDTVYYFRVEANITITTSTSTSPTITGILPSSSASATTNKKTSPSEPMLLMEQIPCADFPGLTSAIAFEAARDNAYPPLASPPSDEAKTEINNGQIIRTIRNALYLERRSKNNPAQSEIANAMTCNRWLANYTATKNASSSTESVQAFPSFNASFANNSQLVTTKFVTAFMPLFLSGGQDFIAGGTLAALDPQVNGRAVNDVGISISSSVPISSATAKDYAAQELLTHDGGLVNLYLSLSGRDYTNEAYAWGNRKANLDRLYFVDVLSNCDLSGLNWLEAPACLFGYNTAENGIRQPATAKEALGYFTQGIGIKALKTSLSGTSTLGAQGTIYGGLGVDGPLFYAAQDASNVATQILNNPAGMASLDAYISGNVVTQGALDSLLGPKSAGHSYLGWGVNFSLFVTNSIGIQLQYSVPFESSVQHSIGRVAMLKIGYTKPSSSSAATKSSPSTAQPSSVSNPDTTTQ